MHLGIQPDWVFPHHPFAMNRDESFTQTFTGLPDVCLRFVFESIKPAGPWCTDDAAVGRSREPASAAHRLPASRRRWDGACASQRTESHSDGEAGEVRLYIH